MCRALPYTKCVDWGLEFKLSPNVHFDKIINYPMFAPLLWLKITPSTNFTCQVQIVPEALKTTKVNILTITSWSVNSGKYLKLRTCTCSSKHLFKNLVSKCIYILHTGAKFHAYLYLDMSSLYSLINAKYYYVWPTRYHGEEIHNN